MCVSPNKLPDHTLVACRKCWQCRENKILDWQGRCIAETKTSVASSSITLTYGRDEDGNVSHVRAALLTYSDVQKYFKRLRRSGHRFSYFVVGEYGSLKGRAHWHAIIFWRTAPPPHQLRTNFNDPHWPHGHSYWEPADAVTAVRYVCKYILKDLDDAEAQGHLAMSKKPPLGSDYFAQRAEKMVAAGLSPQDLFYSFSEAKNRNGKPLKFMLKARSAELFCEEYIRLWRGYPRRGFQGPPSLCRGYHYPPSEMLNEYEDRISRTAPMSADEVDQLILDKPAGNHSWQSAVVAIDPDKPIDPRSFMLDRMKAEAYARRMSDRFELEP